MSEARINLPDSIDNPFWVRVLAAWVVIVPCVSYAVGGGVSPLWMLAFSGLLPALARGRAVPLTTRYLAWAGTLCGLVTVTVNTVAPVDKSRLFFPATEVLLPLLVSVAVALAYLPLRGWVVGGIVGLSLAAFALQGGSLNDPVSFLRGGGGIWNSRYWLFGVFLALELAGVLPLLRYGQLAVPGDAAGGWRRAMAWLAAALMMAGVTAGGSLLFYRNFRSLEQAMRSFVELGSRRWAGRLMFPSEADLFRTVDAKAGQRRRVVLRVRSAAVPGYLRGRVYTVYEGGRWSGQGGGVGLAPVVDPALASTRFRRGRWEGGEDAAQWVDVYPGAGFESDVWFAAGGATAVEAIADQVLGTADGVLAPKGWDRGGGYSYGGGALHPEGAYREPLPGDGATYLQVPERLRQVLAAGEWGGADGARAAIEAVVTTLQTRCEYRLGQKMASGEDPVAQFLAAGAGHCELFATAAAMMLRTAGVPTRYVTGFVCMEPHPRAGMWLARSRDCHAWVEAYVAAERRWVLVEATPASGVPRGDGGRWWDGLGERLAGLWSEGLGLVKRGYVARAVLRGLGAVWELLVWAFWAGPAWFSWFAVVAAAWAVYGWRRGRGGPEKDPAEAELRAVLSMLCGCLARYRIIRTPVMTVADLAAAAADRDTARSHRLADLLRRYEVLRFRPQRPAPTELAAFRREVATALRKIR